MRIFSLGRKNNILIKKTCYRWTNIAQDGEQGLKSEILKMIKIVGSESCEYDCSSRLNVPGRI